jgi:hypothetical protein
VKTVIRSEAGCVSLKVSPSEVTLVNWAAGVFLSEGLFPGGTEMLRAVSPETSIKIAQFEANQ